MIENMMRVVSTAVSSLKTLYLPSCGVQRFPAVSVGDDVSSVAKSLPSDALYLYKLYLMILSRNPIIFQTFVRSR